MFERLGNLVNGFLTGAVSNMERQNPEMLLEVEQDNLRKQIAQYHQGLASHAGLCERLIAQVKKLEAEQQDLRAKTSSQLRAGNRDLAAQCALRLQTVERELDENRKQMEQAENTYKEMIKSGDVAINAARAKIQSMKASISALKRERAMAELTELAAGMNSSVGGSGDTMDRLQTMVEEERGLAAGRIRVVKDLSPPAMQMKDSEQKALADQALADFAAREGIALQSTSADSASAPTPVKSMGMSTPATPQKEG